MPNPLSAIDPLGLATCKVYGKITPDYLARLEQGLGIKPKGISGSIADHVKGLDTEHVSASLTKEATNRFGSSNGLIEVYVKKPYKVGKNLLFIITFSKRLKNLVHLLLEEMQKGL